MNFFKDLLENYSLTLKVSNLLRIKKKKVRVFISVLFKNFVALIEVLIFVLLSFLITGEVANDNLNNYFNIEQIAFLLPVLILFRILINYLDHINSELLSISITESLKKEIFNIFFTKSNLSFAYVNYKNTESENIATIYKIFISIIGTTLQLIIFLVTLVLLDFKISLILTGFVIFLFFPVKKLLYIFKKSAEDITMFKYDIDSILERIIYNFYLIKILKKEETEKQRYESALDRSFKLSRKLQNLIFVRYHIFNSLVTLLISILLVQKFFNVDLSIEILFLLIRGVQFFGNISTQYSDFLSKNHFLKNFINEKNRAYENRGNVDHVKSTNVKYIINIADLDFKYEDSSELIFKELNLKIVANTHNLILGPNGSGKSTLIGLMTNIHIPIKGEVKVFSDVFSYVGPVPLIFNDSLFNNLTYGVETKRLSKNDLISFVKKFKIFDSFNESSLDQNVTSRTLSSGQMQKISFIRAFLRNPDVLFLDESTSNIDQESVEIILNQLSKFNKTVINVTHNPEKFYMADNIFQITNKKLVIND